ncbi:hypothetical protein NQ318_005033 [Aromia moschata]|uniref:Uncharacterized protein n=1 Tax=Aromia moschata TaxID=1265417 RepID=A0AAV8Y8S2_9CUCU|nr:hypothetical protein NQ318_005033 [Aromia moschata]
MNPDQYRSSPDGAFHRYRPSVSHPLFTGGEIIARRLISGGVLIARRLASGDLRYDGSQIWCDACNIPLMCWDRYDCRRHVNNVAHTTTKKWCIPEDPVHVQFTCDVDYLQYITYHRYSRINHSKSSGIITLKWSYPVAQRYVPTYHAYVKIL